MYIFPLKRHVLLGKIMQRRSDFGEIPYKTSEELYKTQERHDLLLVGRRRPVAAGFYLLIRNRKSFLRNIKAQECSVGGEKAAFLQLAVEPMLTQPIKY